MAQYKGKQQTISSVSDILGFILEQSELPPDKRRPVRPPPTADSQAKDDYASTLVDALAMPGTFVGDQYLSTLQSMVDPGVKLQTFNDRTGDIKIKASDLPKFFENPDAFVDKLFEKNKNTAKMQKISWAGEQMRMLAGSTYAKKMGLFNNYGELQPLLERAVGQAAMDAKSDRDKQWIVMASEELRKKGFISNDPKLRESGLEKISELKAKLATIDKVSDSATWDQINEQIGQIEKNLTNINSFRSLLSEEFSAREKNLTRGRQDRDLSKDEMDDVNRLRSAKNLVGIWGNYDSLTKKGLDGKYDPDKKDGEQSIRVQIQKQRQLINDTKKSYLDQIKSIQNSNASKAYKDVEIKRIKNDVKNLSAAERSILSADLWGRAGRLEGAYYGLKNTLGPGGFEAFLNGDFFDPRKGFFGCPSTSGQYELKGQKPGLNSLEFVKAKDGDTKLSKGYNEAMVNLYYLNPTTWVKSLYTGEVFAWMADKYKNKSKELFSIFKEGSLDVGQYKNLKDPKFWDFFTKFDKADEKTKFKLSQTDEYKEFGGMMKRVSVWLGDPEKYGKYAKFAKMGKLVSKFQKMEESFSKLATFFSTPKRLLGFLNGKLQKGLGKMRGRIFDVLSKMKFFANSKASMALLTTWKATGGAALSSAISTALLTALKVSATAIAGPVGTIVTILISGLMDKVLKVAIKVIIFAFVGIFGLVIIIGASFTHKNQIKADTYSLETPNSIIYNTGFGGYGDSDEISGDWDYDRGEIPPLSDQECILEVPNALCTQGFIDIPEGYTHHTLGIYKPADLAFLGNIYAPQFCDKAAGNCVITRAWEQYSEEYRKKWCGGIEANPGGELFLDGSYTDDAGISHEFRLEFYHVVLFVPHVEDSNSSITVDAGEPLVRIGTTADGLNTNGCWHGAHLHYSTKIDGAYVDPLALLNSWGCSLPSEDQCTI